MVATTNDEIAATAAPRQSRFRWRRPVRDVTTTEAITRPTSTTTTGLDDQFVETDIKNERKPGKVLVVLLAIIGTLIGIAFVWVTTGPWVFEPFSNSPVALPLSILYIIVGTLSGTTLGGLIGAYIAHRRAIKADESSSATNS